VQHNHALLALRSHDPAKSEARKSPPTSVPNPNLAWDAQFHSRSSIQANFNSDYFSTTTPNFDTSERAILFERGKKTPASPAGPQKGRHLPSPAPQVFRFRNARLIFKRSHNNLLTSYSPSPLCSIRPSRNLDSFSGTTVQHQRKRPLSKGRGAMSEGDFSSSLPKIKVSSSCNFKPDVFNRPSSNRIQALASLRQFFSRLRIRSRRLRTINRPPGLPAGERLFDRFKEFLASRSPSRFARRPGRCPPPRAARESARTSQGKQDLTAGLSYSHNRRRQTVSTRRLVFSIPLAILRSAIQGEIARTRLRHYPGSGKLPAKHHANRFSTDVLDALRKSAHHRSDCFPALSWWLR